MATKVTLIIGPMRSGTSAVSEVVHYLGSSCGTSIAAPVPPSWRSDWEDFELSTSLARLLPMGPQPPTHAQRLAVIDFLARYVKHRMHWHELVSQIPDARQCGWSMKSPLLALVFEEVRAAILDEEDLRLRVLTVRRSPEGIAGSWAGTMANIAGAAFTQAHISEALLNIKADYVVDYDELVADPERIVPRIANAIGCTDDEAIVRAVQRVRFPTSDPMQTAEA